MASATVTNTGAACITPTLGGEGKHEREVWDASETKTGFDTVTDAEVIHEMTTNSGSQFTTSP